MTIGSSLGRVVYTGNSSTTAFAFNAPVAADTEIKVFTVVIATGVQTLQTKGGSGTYDYSVSINSGTKFATVTLNNAPPDTIRVVIIRNVPITQTTDYVAGDPFPAETHEAALDKLTTLATQISEVADRSVKVQESSATSNISMSELVADKVVKVNSAADGLEMGPTTANLDTLAAITSDITTVAGISSNVTSVAGNATNINAVAADATDIGAVAAKATEIGRLGTSDAVADMALLATTDVIADMALLGTSANVAAMALLGTSDAISDINTLATSDIVSDLNTLATSDIVSDLNTLATSDIVSDINTLATSDIVSDLNTLATSDIVTDLNILGTSANVTNMATLGASGVVSNIATVSGSIANVNTTASNISGVNSFAARYRVTAGDPGSDNDAGDLNYNTSANVLKFYNGSAWVSIDSTTALGSEVTGTLPVANGGTGATSLTSNGVLIGNGTSAVTAVDLSTKGKILAGDGSGNPSALSVGTNDYVLTADSSEATGLKWALAAAGATGGGTDQVFYENARVMTTNYTITTSKSASTVGPLTINSGITLTIPSGERLVIL